MKITKSRLKQIIKEELFRLMEDFDDPTATGRWTDEGPVYICDELKAELDAAVEREASLYSGDPMQYPAEAEIRKLSKEYEEKCGS